MGGGGLLVVDGVGSIPIRIPNHVIIYRYKPVFYVVSNESY